jgi:hypothetical protein
VLLSMPQSYGNTCRKIKSKNFATLPKSHSGVVHPMIRMLLTLSRSRLRFN